jgi:hypothetical protein
MEWQLTEKALFPESDIEAAKNVCASLGVVIDFMDKMVKQVNRDPEVLELWEIGKGLQAAAEIYYAGGPDDV